MVNDLIISACWETSGTWVTLFAMLIRLFNLCDIHGIITECLLYLPNSLSITRPDTITLFKLLSFLGCVPNKNPTGTVYTPLLIDWLPATNTLCVHRKKFTNVHEDNLHLFLVKIMSCALLISVGKKSGWIYFLQTLFVCIYRILFYWSRRFIFYYFFPNINMN